MSIYVFSEILPSMMKCKKNILDPDRPRKKIRHMRIACCAIKSTNTHPVYAIFVAFPIHQLSQEHPSTLRHSTLPNTYLSQLLYLTVSQFMFAHCSTAVTLHSYLSDRHSVYVRSLQYRCYITQLLYLTVIQFTRPV